MRMADESIESQQKPEVFAKAVVKSLLEIKPKAEVFKGNLATMAWVLTTFLPRWALVSFHIDL
jgi:1-acylglycerone phosphate reductase